MHERYLSFPFHVSAEGRVETADEDRHIRQRLEQILFTSPGERVMLPEFGCGARDLVFAGNNEALAAAAEFRIAKALQTHMGEQVLINAVDVTGEGEQLRIHIVYTKARDLQQETAVFRLFPTDAVSRG